MIGNGGSALQSQHFAAELVGIIEPGHHAARSKSLTQMAVILTRWRTIPNSGASSADNFGHMRRKVTC